MARNLTWFAEPLRLAIAGPDTLSGHASIFLYFTLWGDLTDDGELKALTTTEL
jgi:hypothetical protein